MSFVNVAAYKFVTLPAQDLPGLRALYRRETQALQLKGTLLLSTEGINLFLSGSSQHIATLKKIVAELPAFRDLHYKESLSAKQPFHRMLVKIKREIIAFGIDTVRPEHSRAPYVSPKALKAWYDQKRPITLLDTRNAYETRLGHFEGALDLGLQHFREFPDALTDLVNKNLLPKEQPIVTYCTGGIRCEKAAAWMVAQGFKEVYQLEGGILNYFEQCAGDYYRGECFVFDQRVALDAQLAETSTVQCFSCRNPLSLEEQQKNNQVCPYCATPGNQG